MRPPEMRSPAVRADGRAIEIDRAGKADLLIDSPIPAERQAVAATAAYLSEAARLAADAHRILVASVMSLEAAEVEIAPAAEVEIAELLDDTDAYAGEMLRVAGGNHDHLVHHDCSNDDHLVRALDLPELPYSDAAYVEMWNRVAAEWRARNSFRHMRDYGCSRSSIMTKADLQRQIYYLEGAPEMQRAAFEVFKERQAERDAEMARRARRNSHGKQEAQIFMAERRVLLKTLSKGRRR